MRRLWWIGLLAALVAAGTVVVVRRTPRGAEEARWRTAPVVRGNLVVTVSASGSVYPSSEVEVRSRATGIARRVLVAEGDRVQAGQVLVEIDDPDASSALQQAQANYEAARARLSQVRAQRLAASAQERQQIQQAEANLQAARARLGQLESQHALDRAQRQTQIAQAQAALEAAWARLRQVEQGPRPEEVQQAEEALRGAQAELELARKEYARIEPLVQQGFVARQQLDEAAARVTQAVAQVRSATARLAQLRSGPTPEEREEARAALRQAEAQLRQALTLAADEAVRAQEIAAARAAVRQAEAQLRQARAAALQDAVRAQEVAAAEAALRQAQANLENARERVRETLIRSPVSGLVSTLSVQVGQSVIGSAQGGTPVMRIAVVDPVLAKVMVDEIDVPQIRPGMAASVRADALPDEVFRGSVLSISPNAQVNNNVVQYAVTLRVEDPHHRLRLGMTVQAEFELVRHEGVLLVPREAIRGQGTVLVVQNGRLRPRRVILGPTDGRMVEVRSGLREGEVVFLGEVRGGGAQPARNPFMPQFPRRTPAGGPPRGP